MSYIDLITGALVGTPRPEARPVSLDAADARLVTGGAALVSWPEADFYYRRDAAAGGHDRDVGRYQDLHVFTRSSAARDNGWDGAHGGAAGPLETIASGVPVLTGGRYLSHPAVTNAIRNPLLEGGSAGSPGSMPTNTTMTDGGGTRTLAFGADAFSRYMQMRYQGSNLSDITLPLETTTQIVAVNGQTWTQLAFARLVAGSWDNTGGVALNLSERDSGGGFVNSNTSGAVFPVLGGPPLAVRLSRTLDGGGSTARLHPRLLFPGGSGAYDFTVRIYLPHCVQLPCVPVLALPPSGSPGAATVAQAVSHVPLADIFRAGPGTILCDVVTTGLTGGNQNNVWQLNDGSTPNRLGLYFSSSGALSLVRASPSTSSEFTGVWGGVHQPGRRFRVAVGWSGSQYWVHARHSGGGVLALNAQSFAAAVPVGAFTRLYQGADAATNLSAARHLELDYRDRLLTPAEMAEWCIL